MTIRQFTKALRPLMDHTKTVYYWVGSVSDKMFIPSQFIARNPVPVHQSVQG